MWMCVHVILPEYIQGDLFERFQHIIILIIRQAFSLLYYRSLHRYVRAKNVIVILD